MTETRAFERRFFFRGRLELETGLHIGAGDRGLSPSDMPVLRGADDRPFIPGSSVKGAFRAMVEKLGASVPGLWSCGFTAGDGCIGPQGDDQKKFNRERQESNWEERDLVERINGKLCDTCRLFGSPYLAGKLYFYDLSLADDGGGVVQIRDGVAIDRDSEEAVDRLKYDYEVVSPSQNFSFKLHLDDPDPGGIDLGLACIGLSEWLAGLGQLGGKRSRGLGKVRLTGLEIFSADFSGNDAAVKAKRLRQYLLGRSIENKMDRTTDTDGFLEQAVDRLLTAAPHRAARAGRGVASC